MRILITGATGKVGEVFLKKILSDENYPDASIVALCHNRSVAEHERIEIIHGSIADRDTVKQATKNITHALHLATCKETPDEVMDVTVKGLFWLLEECRQNIDFEQFILIGGDASMGHFFYPHHLPVTENQPHSAYPGCYALSKVIEEVMLEQYQIQYGFPGCCLRAPWIMEKDDFKFSLTFGKDVFGGPCWRELVGSQQADTFLEQNTIPLMQDGEGNPVKRNFVHVDDLVSAILAAFAQPQQSIGETFNVCMDEPVDYGEVANYLKQTRDIPSVAVETPYHSTWLDNSKAKFMLGWKPQVDLKLLIDRAWDYERPANQPRQTWYPG
jgi:nucleoside-diphosphate-sugar epimerase